MLCQILFCTFNVALQDTFKVSVIHFTVWIIGYLRHLKIALFNVKVGKRYLKIKRTQPTEQKQEL